MKQLFLYSAVLLFSFSLQPLHAQKKKRKDEAELFYLFKQDWTDAPNLDSAAYFMQIVKDNDSAYICRYYNKYGPMAKQESFKDEQLTIPNGLFCWYNKDGYLDSIGWVREGYKDGSWIYFRNDKWYLAVRYKNKKVVEKQDLDSDIYIDSTGTSTSLKAKWIKDSLRADSLKPTQIPAKFNGNWIAYIRKNLKTPERLQNVMGSGKYLVIASFAIDKEGNVTEVYLTKSCEWSADAAVLQRFKNAPKWTPAQQNGHPVIYRQKEAFTFVVEEY